ncbi:MAG: DUF1653 domain-containing protein [Myxococcales bacterium]|nr:DUF1653 domain-containing protein [Myxococcales bacterium]USN51678.1 MAG: DUF1653 domain-containing protein [Myxococcales bacterium]
MKNLANDINPGEIWRHYKGKNYRIIALSLHSEDLSPYVVYEALYENPISKIWHRPLALFLGSLQVNGNVVSRFIKLDSDL